MTEQLPAVIDRTKNATTLHAAHVVPASLSRPSNDGQRNVRVFNAEISSLIQQPLACRVFGRAVVRCLRPSPASAGVAARDYAVRGTVVVLGERFDPGPKTTACRHASDILTKKPQHGPEGRRAACILADPARCTREIFT
jgi:hypothetical protein